MNHKNDRFEAQYLYLQIIVFIIQLYKYPSHHTPRYYIYMQEQAFPDGRNIQTIMATNNLCHFHINDFKIVQGLRLYRLSWRENDGTLRFKWQKLQKLQNHLDVIYQYQKRNKSKVSKIQNQWVQYYLDGQTKNPYVYLDLRKLKQHFSEDHDESADSQFEIDHKTTIKKSLKFMVAPNMRPQNNNRKLKSKVKKINKIWPEKGQIPISGKIDPTNQQKQSLNRSSLSERLYFESESPSSSPNKQSHLQISSEKESSSYSVAVEPEVRYPSLLEPIEMSKKREQIMMICHEAIQKGNRELQNKKSKEVLQPVIIQQKRVEQMQQEASQQVLQILGKSMTIKSQNEQPQKSQLLKMHQDIFTPDESLNNNIQQVELQSNSSDANQLRNLNVRQYLLNKFKSMNIQAPKDSQHQDHHPQAIESLKKPNKNEGSPKPSIKNGIKQKQNLDYISLIQNLQANTRHIIQQKQETKYLSNEKHISSNILAYESALQGNCPKILKINYHFSYHNLIFYSISVGNAYSHKQMFAIYATLQKIDPNLLRRYCLQKQNQ